MKKTMFFIFQIFNLKNTNYISVLCINYLYFLQQNINKHTHTHTNNSKNNIKSCSFTKLMRFIINHLFCFSKFHSDTFLYIILKF
jgi:hypothetical protein